MAKKKTTVKLKQTATKKKEVVVATKLAAPAKSKTGMVIGIVALIIAALIAESYIIIQKQIKFSKKPTFKSTWSASSNKAISGIQVYGESAYVIDAANNQVCRYDKTSGKLTGIYQAKINTCSAAEGKDGIVYVLIADGTILKFKGEKPAGEIKIIDGVTKASWITVDSLGNFYVADNDRKAIVKLDQNFVKLLEFAGVGTTKDKLASLGKIYMSPMDEVYVLDAVTKEVKAFSSEGKFLKAFKVTNIEKFSGLEALAISPGGDVYVNDFNGSMILEFGKDGKIKGKFDTDSNGSFKVSYPGVVAGGSDGIIIVSSANIGVFEEIK